jgi:hypothetical protein
MLNEEPFSQMNVRTKILSTNRDGLKDGKANESYALFSSRPVSLRGSS